MAEERLVSFRNKSIQERKARAAQQREEAERMKQAKAAEETAVNKEPEIAKTKIKEESMISKATESENNSLDGVTDTEPKVPDSKINLPETDDDSKAEKAMIETPAEESNTIKRAEMPSDKSVKSKPVSKETASASKKTSRKKVEEERKVVYIKCGDEAYTMVRKAANWSRTSRNDYMCTLVENEMKVYAKNPEGYIASRTKKVAEMAKAEKTGNKSVSFSAGYDIIDFLSDIVYDVEGTRDSFLRAVIAMDYEKKLKERSK